MATGAEMLKTNLSILQDLSNSISRIREKLPTEDATSATARLQDIGVRVQVLSQKMSLRAKGGNELAFPVAEATARLNESFDMLRSAAPGSHEDALADVRADLEALEREVGVLEEQVRARTVVVT